RRLVTAGREPELVRGGRARRERQDHHEGPPRGSSRRGAHACTTRPTPERMSLIRQRRASVMTVSRRANAVPAPRHDPTRAHRSERTTSMNRRSLAALSIAALAWAAALVPAPALASSHSEAPGTSKDRLADDTDLYAWVAADAPGSVTIVGNWVPLIEPNSGPNFASFDDDAHYYINVDNRGDSHKHIRFEFTFKTTRQN